MPRNHSHFYLNKVRRQAETKVKKEMGWQQQVVAETLARRLAAFKARRLSRKNR